MCWRSGKATLSNTYIEPNSAPSWKSTPILRRSASSSGIVRSLTTCPLTITSPESGNISPMMCLISTLLPVPDGPSTTVIVSSGKATFSRRGRAPRRGACARPGSGSTTRRRLGRRGDRGRSRGSGGRSSSDIICRSFIHDVRELAGFAVEGERALWQAPGRGHFVGGLGFVGDRRFAGVGGCCSRLRISSETFRWPDRSPRGRCSRTSRR